MFKKFLALSMILGSMTFAVVSAEAKTATETVSSAVETNFVPQWGQRNRRNNQRVVRTVVRTVRRGRMVYRETYRVVTNRNGRTTTTLVSRVRVR
jgi:hypothetical protein